jgi:2-polyprenyl-3-methyl-5-hydroxy-6-metoxy-1,4-benzoquinol methylase
MDHIPNETKRILDVGSGSGNLAMKLINKGFQTDCVIPSEFLAEQVLAKLEDRSTIHICGFESVSDSEVYDLILFSESFQYVKLGKSLDKISNMLTPSGHLLICDFFKRDGVGKSPMGGGHGWQGFQNTIAKQPLILVTDLDITEETSPTIDLLAKFNTDVVTPIAEMSGEYLLDHYPKLSKIFRWKFKKRLNKIHNIYLSGAVNGTSFKQFKEYHLLVYRKG